MTAGEIIVQLLGLIGTGLYLVSFQFKAPKHIFLVQCGAYLFYVLHYCLLGAYTGAASYAVNLLRSFLLICPWQKARSPWACAALCVMQIAGCALTWGGWISLLPCAANIATTVGAYTYKPKVIRAASLFINSPLFIVYALIVGSWPGLLDEIISDVSIIVSVVRFGWKE